MHCSPERALATEQRAVLETQGVRCRGLKGNVLADNLLGARSAKLAGVHVGGGEEIHKVVAAVGVSVGHQDCLGTLATRGGKFTGEDDVLGRIAGSGRARSNIECTVGLSADIPGADGVLERNQSVEDIIVLNDDRVGARASELVSASVLELGELVAHSYGRA